MWVKSPKVIEKLYPSAIWKMPDKEKNIYLTFDDGPHPEVTPWVLDKLDEYKAKATFFCIGRNVERYPDVFEEIKNRGHEVGNHTYSHIKGWKSGNKDYLEDVALADGLIKSSLFRPPYGKIKTTQLRTVRKDFRIIMWDVLSMDYNTTVTPEKCLDNVLNYVGRGSVVVFHDSLKAEKNMKYALVGVLDDLTLKKYQLKEIKI